MATSVACESKGQYSGTVPTKAACSWPKIDLNDFQTVQKISTVI